MDPLLPSFRRELRARAHALHPVVAIGHHGLTPAVLHEIDIALAAHELVKVRVQGDDRDGRKALFGRIVDALDCAPVQQIGKLLVLWRPRPVEDRKERGAKRRAGGSTAGKRDGAPHAISKGHHPASTQTKRPPALRSGPAAQRADRVPPKESARVRKPGKAPAGVPRAAAPRRRRRAP